MPKIDLKIYPFLRHSSRTILEGGTHVCRKIDFLTDYGLHATTNLSSLCGKVSWQFQGQNILLSRSIPLHGLCTDHIQGKSSRHRSLPSFSEQQALSYGHSRERMSFNPGRCKRKTRLANLCRTGPFTYSNSPYTLQQRYLHRRTRRNHLRARFHDNRSLLISFPLGNFPQKQRGHQAPHSSRFERKYPNVHLHFRRQTARCQRLGSHTLGSRCILCHGSWIRGLQSSPFFYRDSGFLCHSRQNQHQIQKTLLPSGRSGYRFSLRSNHFTHRQCFAKRLPWQAQTGQVPRCDNRQDLGIFNEQFQSACLNDSPVVSQSLASGTIFQMDQTESQNQKLLRYIRKRCEDPNLDSHLSVRSRCHHEKGTSSQREPLHNFTGVERFSFRKNANLSTNYRTEMQKRTDTYM